MKPSRSITSVVACIMFTGCVFAGVMNVRPLAGQIVVPEGAGDRVGVSISSVMNPRNPPGSALEAHVGDTLTIQGHGFTNSTIVKLVVADPIGSQLVPSKNNEQLSMEITPLRGTSSTIRFVVPDKVSVAYSGPNQQSLSPYFLVVRRGTAADTVGPIQLGLARPVRKILSVEQTVVRSSNKIKIHGIGFSSKFGPSSYGEVTGAYFGTGAPGSSTNPRMAVVNQSDTYVELWLPSSCDQEGILMLAAPGSGSSENLILADKPITVACVRATPKGVIAGSEQKLNGRLPVLPGEVIKIRGTQLRYVTKVVDTQGNSYPFKFTNQGAFENLELTIPATQPGGTGIQFLLENNLTDPVVGGTVDGAVLVAALATWSSISPVWAEPGQNVTITGRNISHTPGDIPTVTVGGVPAQVIKADNLTLEIRLAAATTSGPIVIRNMVGTTQLTGPFVTHTGTQHPGFFVVNGPSSVTSVVGPATPLADGDTVVIKGQNLARLHGICVLSSGASRRPAGAMVELTRVYAGLSSREDGIMTNDEMKVVVPWASEVAVGTAIQMLAPTLPPAGGNGSSGRACTANTTSVIWPRLVAAQSSSPPPPPPPPPPPSPPPAGSTGASTALSMAFKAASGVTVSAAPTCTDGSAELTVTGSAPNFTVAIGAAGTTTITCQFSITAPGPAGSPPPSVPPPSAPPASSSPGENGSSRVVLDGGDAKPGSATFICQPMDGKMSIMIAFGGESGVLGAIGGKVPRAGAATYEFVDDADKGLTAGFSRLSMPVASFPATSGTVTFTEWTKTVVRGSFKYTGETEDANGVSHKHSVTGSFSAVPMMGC